MAKKNELAVKAADFNLVTLTGDLAEAVAEEMDGLGTIPFDRVKIPSGGGLAFEIPGEEEDDTETAQELIGVILDHGPVNAYWANKFAGGNEQPDCSSFDGKQGVDRITGEIKNCATCPYNQFGSDNAGKACKNVHRVYILREDNPVPLILSLPPTSLKYMRDYIGKRVILKGFRCWQVLTKITLKKEKSKDGIVYSRAAFAFVDKLTPEQAQQTKAMRDVVKNTYRTIEIDSGDYSTKSTEEATAPPKVDEAGFMNIPEGQDADLPFN
ncbi:MAG: hypothetical protein NC432_06755 [Roseburia sp.]|nr:hypothetical protein [Roseburia sp.]MCM1097709.1 hypothetical protein [Ruminococcus flavefaciens]